uniref:Uncharacterized protein n=1 Tax=Avena sativa TaxID=4498 RepID=A0ACD5TY79_AVESA
MEAAPALCNLLQSVDKTIHESALSCLGMLASGARGKAEHMDKLCESNIVETGMRLLEKDGWKTLGEERLHDILGLLKSLASASAKAVKSLFDLGVCNLLHQMITYYNSLHSNSDKLQMLVEFIYELMRPLEASDTTKNNAILEHNAYIDQISSIVTLIIQVAKCGAVSSVCYRCIVIIGNIVELSTPTFLIELQKTANLSSFLTCLLARKDRHVVFQTLKVSKSLLQKHHQFFLESFTKEGLGQSLLKDPFFDTIFLGKIPGDVDESDPSYGLLFTLRVLEGLNRFSYQLSMDEKIRLFAESCLRDFDDLKVTISPIPQLQFMSSLMTNKLELQMKDSLFEDGLIPSWCIYLVETCPFLFSFNARWKYFCLTLHRSFTGDNTGAPDEPDEEDGASDAQNEAAKKTKKYKVTRGNILENAVPMMAKHGSSTKTIEVVFEGEVGTGRGPTLEFYSTATHELQRFGIGMWRGDNARKAEGETGFVHSKFGLFPQPWSSVMTSSRGVEFSDVVQKFKLLGHIVARAILDGRILDIPLSKTFYKIMLERELDIYDIPSFDPELGKTILEFQALVKRKKFLETCSENTSNPSAALSYKNMRLEDLCLDFTLPGNPEFELVPGGSEKMVTLDNLEEYVHLLVDATLKSGIAKQMEAFKSAINEVFALKTLRMFNEEEMERILCGEQDAWASSKLADHIEFEHGYDAHSPPVVNFLEILREFGREEQRAFIQFTTGAPQLPLGGLASLDPKLTVVRKQCDCGVDSELPSVNTCRHFIKLPPYSSKEIMRERLKYALAEGLGSFHLS